jgi:hypothetical protein
MESYSSPEALVQMTLLSLPAFIGQEALIPENIS